MTKALSEITNFVETEAPKPSLPDKPSEYLTVALADFKRAGEHSDIYRRNLYAYYIPAADTGDGRCIICLAGAYIAFTLGYGPDGFPYGPGRPLGSGGAEVGTLRAISAVAFGGGSAVLGVLALGDVESESYVSYDSNPTAWTAYVHKVIETLKEHGL